MPLEAALERVGTLDSFERDTQRLAEDYDAIVQMVSRIDSRRAREAAAQAFRSDNPLRSSGEAIPRELQELRGRAPE